MNEVLDTLMTRASVRSYRPDPVPQEVLEQVVRAGQQAPFTGQMYSVISAADRETRDRLVPLFGNLVRRAPLFLLVLVDVRKLEKFVQSKGRRNRLDDLSMLVLGVQDAAYMAQNMVIAAESLGLGSVFLGAAPWQAPALADMFQLPPRVYPLVGLCLGYPDESPPPRPRVPLRHVLFSEGYRDLSDDDVQECLEVMDAGLIREGYYQRAARAGQLGPREGEDQVPDDYGWGEHVSRKYGEALARSRATANLREKMRGQGFDV